MKLDRIVVASALVATVGLLALPSGCRSVEYRDHGVVFEATQVSTGAARSQAIVTGSFLSDASTDVAVVSVDDAGKRRVAIYAPADDGWESAVGAALSDEVLFVDVARIGEDERLLTYDGSELKWFDPDKGVERPLVEIAAAFDTDATVAPIDVTHDLDLDGRDDVIVPDFDGFWIALQQSDGSFGAATKIGPPEPFLDEVGLDEQRTYRDVGLNATTVPWYLGRVHRMDHDLDGLEDLAFWNGEHFELHRQSDEGGFAVEREEFTVDVPFDSDAPYSLMFGFGSENTFALMTGFRGASKRTILHAFRDVDGDGLADLVTHTLEGRSLVNQRSTYAVHPGRATPDGLAFDAEPATTLRPNGRAGAMQPWGYSVERVDDFDGDGRDDVAFRDVHMGVGKMLRAMFGNSITMDIEVYCLQDGAYPPAPTARIEVRPAIDLTRRSPFFPTVLHGDVNGDGLDDLLIGQAPGELGVFVGVSEPSLFAAHPQKVEVVLPDDERNTWLVDLDHDGKQDLLAHHPSSEGSHSLTILMAE